MSVPIGLMRAYVHELPALQAEEVLRDSHAVALGSGSMKAHDRQSAVRALQRLALHGRQKARAVASPTVLSSMGIGVTSGH